MHRIGQKSITLCVRPSEFLLPVGVNFVAQQVVSDIQVELPAVCAGVGIVLSIATALGAVELPAVCAGVGIQGCDRARSARLSCLRFVQVLELSREL